MTITELIGIGLPPLLMAGGGLVAWGRMNSRMEHVEVKVVDALPVDTFTTFQDGLKTSLDEIKSDLKEVKQSQTESALAIARLEERASMNALKRGGF